MMLGVARSVMLAPFVMAIFVAVVAVWAVRRSRAAVFDEDRYPGLVALRRQTAEGIVAAVGLVLTLSLIGVALGAALPVASWCAVLALVPGGGTVKRS